MLRKAVIGDAGVLYDWRQQDENAPWWQGDRVEWAAHTHWFWQRLNSPSVGMWMLEADGELVGQARCDSNGELSFSITAEQRGKGYGGKLVKAATAAATEMGHSRLKASVDGTNHAGLRTLEATGFQHRPDVLFYRYSQ